MDSRRTTEIGASERGYRDKDRDESAAAKLWAVYISEAEKYDKALVERWRSDMDGLLIFAGLFSASLTAFLIESYKTLSPDQANLTIKILAQISRQLSASGNASSVEVPMPESFTPSASSLACNTLWFLSLGLSLSCALIATLVEQWARDFIQKTDMRPSPIIRARTFSYLYYGLRRFKMHGVVELIPLLLHISLILFFAGLVAFLQPVHIGMASVAAALLLVILFVYTYLTVLPILHSDCPYRTPLSGLMRYVLLRGLSILQHVQDPGMDSGAVSPTSGDPKIPTLVEVMMQHATSDSSERVDRDCRALIWTMKSLTDDEELEPLVEAISDVIWGSEGRRWLYDKQIGALLLHPNVRLIPRIEGLLRGCESGLLPVERRHRRQISCLKTIWAIAHLDVQSQKPFHGFNFDALRLRTLDTVDPIVQPYLLSAQALSRCNVARWAELKLRRTWEMLHTLRSEILASGSGILDLPALDDAYRELQNLTNHASGLKTVRSVPDGSPPADPQDKLGRIHDHLISCNRTVPSTAQIMVGYLEDASTLHLPPYELFSTCDAMAKHVVALTDNDRSHICLRFAAIISEDHVNRLKTHPGVHHIDRITGKLLSLWQEGSDLPSDQIPPRFIESLLRYIGSRDGHEPLMTGLGRCDHRRLSSSLTPFMKGNLFSEREVFEGIWRLCAFYAHLPLDPVNSPQMVPAGFDERTVIAIQSSAPRHISQSITALMRLLMLWGLPSEQLPSMHPLASRSWPMPPQNDPEWDQARCETHWLIIIEFMEDCASLHLPYNAADTLRSILDPASWKWGTFTMNRTIQRRFSRSLLRLGDSIHQVGQGASTRVSRLDFVQMILNSWIFTGHDRSPVIRPFLNDAEALRTISDVLEMVSDSSGLPRPLKITQVAIPAADSDAIAIVLPAVVQIVNANNRHLTTWNNDDTEDRLGWDQDSDGPRRVFEAVSVKKGVYKFKAGNGKFLSLTSKGILSSGTSRWWGSVGDYFCRQGSRHVLPEDIDQPQLLPRTDRKRTYPYGSGGEPRICHALCGANNQQGNL
ncbi:hypothetical protein C8R45DRAFT_307679 [Mycena sanguinolenta]|nr:hypothetical protein C8R45DRAFT_307679 [Mycena sanguinolenta]